MPNEKTTLLTPAGLLMEGRYTQVPCARPCPQPNPRGLPCRPLRCHSPNAASCRRLTSGLCPDRLDLGSRSSLSTGRSLGTDFPFQTPSSICVANWKSGFIHSTTGVSNSDIGSQRFSVPMSTADGKSATLRQKVIRTGREGCVFWRSDVY